MKEKRNLLMCMALATTIGWVAGFLRLPSFENNHSFLLGFSSAIAFVFLVLILRKIWNKNKDLIQSLHNQSDTSLQVKNYQFVWTILTVLILSACALNLFFIHKHREYSKDQVIQQNQKILEQSQLIESTRKSNLLVLMNNLYDKIDKELDQDPKRKLSEKTMARIEALNHSFQPYAIFEQDSLSEKSWSPERGQLLLTLASMNMDTSSFNQIKRRISFAGADLRKADLSEMNLSGIDLKKANFKEATLHSTNLSNAEVSDANFFGANLIEAKLENSILHRVNFSWANLNNANLSKSNLNGVTLDDAQLRNTNLQQIKMIWAKSNNAMYNNADLTGSDLSGTELKNANLGNANFSNTILKWVDLGDAILDSTNFTQVDLSKATVFDKKWMEKLKEWNVKGADKIEKSYQIENGIPGKNNFRIMKLKDKNSDTN